MSDVKKSEVGIIDLIQQMVADGESEEKIVQTLKDLGVDAEKAKRLLLLGQADTFALLRSEISKIVMADVEKQKPHMIKFMEDEAKKLAKEVRSNVKTEIMADVEGYEKELGGRAAEFQTAINDNVSKLSELGHEVRKQLNQVGTDMKQMKLDVDELRLRGLSAKNKWVSTILIITGIIFLAVDLYLFVTNFNTVINIDNLIWTLIIAIVGLTMIFVATII